LVPLLPHQLWVLEMYQATKGVFKDQLQQEAAAAALPLLHAGADGWTSKISKAKFLGVRVQYVTADWRLATNLLSVKQFRPAQTVTALQQLSDVQHVYFQQVSFSLSVSNSCWSCAMLISCPTGVLTSDSSPNLLEQAG
jgi:hypothetical protein